jgi:flavodoxin
MKKAIILYHSKTGNTREYARQITEYLKSKKLEASFKNIYDYQEGLLDGADYILLGCWTSGLMLFFQHPDRAWKTFAKKLPGMKNAKVGFFTTYKILTGSMFMNMYKHLDGKTDYPSIQLKSRNSNLSENDKKLLDSFSSS